MEGGRFTFPTLSMSPASKSGVGRWWVGYDGSESWFIPSISEMSYLLVAESAEVN